MENSQNTSPQVPPTQAAADAVSPSVNSMQEAMMTHLLAENAFLRAQVEQHARAEAELRAALRETVRAMPKAITTGQGEDKTEETLETRKADPPLRNATARMEERIAATVSAPAKMETPVAPMPAPASASSPRSPVRSTPAPAPHIQSASDDTADDNQSATKTAQEAAEKLAEKPRRTARPLVAPPLTPNDVYVPQNPPGQPVALQSAMQELSRRRVQRPLWKKMLGMR